MAKPATIRYLRLSRSAIIPMPKPKSIGRNRRKNVTETRKGESVNSSANNATTSISSHIIVPVIQPTDQSRRNCPFRSSVGCWGEVVNSEGEIL